MSFELLDTLTVGHSSGFSVTVGDGEVRYHDSTTELAVPMDYDGTGVHLSDTALETNSSRGVLTRLALALNAMGFPAVIDPATLDPTEALLLAVPELEIPLGTMVAIVGAPPTAVYSIISAPGRVAADGDGSVVISLGALTQRDGRSFEFRVDTATFRRAILDLLDDGDTLIVDSRGDQVGEAEVAFLSGRLQPIAGIVGVAASHATATLAYSRHLALLIVTSGQATLHRAVRPETALDDLVAAIGDTMDPLEPALTITTWNGGDEPSTTAFPAGDPSGLRWVVLSELELLDPEDADEHVLTPHSAIT